MKNTLSIFLFRDSADVDARHRLAKWAMEDGDLARARSLLEAVVRDAPSFGPARVLLAKVYYRLNLRQQGREQEQVAKRLEAESQNRQQPPDPN